MVIAGMGFAFDKAVLHGKLKSKFVLHYFIVMNCVIFIHVYFKRKF